MVNKENFKSKKSIIIYFSRADENYGVGVIEKGNTEVVAEYIKDILDADMFKVEPKVPYSKDYDVCTHEAKIRQSSHNAEIINSILDIADYDVIYLGSPVYWDFMPEEMVTALKEKDFTGKIIRPFVTHEGSGLGSIPNQIKEICLGAKVLDGIAIYGSQVESTKSIIEEWI